MTAPHFGDLLLKALTQRELSQKDFAALIGSSEPAISNIVRGKTVLSAARVDAVCEAIKATRAEKSRFHLAAAIAAGYRIKLPEGFWRGVTASQAGAGGTGK